MTTRALSPGEELFADCESALPDCSQSAEGLTDLLDCLQTTLLTAMGYRTQTTGHRASRRLQNDAVARHIGQMQWVAHAAADGLAASGDMLQSALERQSGVQS